MNLAPREWLDPQTVPADSLLYSWRSARDPSHVSLPFACLRAPLPLPLGLQIVGSVDGNRLWGKELPLQASAAGRFRALFALAVDLFRLSACECSADSVREWGPDPPPLLSLLPHS